MLWPGVWPWAATALMPGSSSVLPLKGLNLPAVTYGLSETISGSGQHVAAFAAAMPHWQWQPSDADATALPSIDAWCAQAGLHIAPWACCAALMRGAARHLAP